jgi:LysM repeat protein
MARDRRAGGRRRRAVALAAGVAAASTGGAALATPAGAAVPHTVQPGETLWGIATANGVSAEAVAAYNGLEDPNYIVSGSTIEVPTAEEAAAVAPASTDGATGTHAVPTDGAPAPAPGETAWLAHIPSPFGDLHLDPGAAASWNAMREESLATFGIDLYPGGALSAFRTYAQQDYLYQLYLAGAGEPANPPGSSTHELGVAVDVAEPVMRDIIDQIGPTYGWYGTIATEWWHVEYLGGY